MPTKTSSTEVMQQKKVFVKSEEALKEMEQQGLLEPFTDYYTPDDSDESSSIIVDYIVPSDTSKVNIDGLDIVGDGGVYEITVNGVVENYIYMTVNNNSSSSYYIRLNIFRDSPLSQYQASQPYFIAGAYTQFGKIYLRTWNESVGIFAEGQGITNGQYATYLTMGLSNVSAYNNNVTSIQLSSTTNSIKAGTRIIVKRVKYNKRGIAS